MIKLKTYYKNIFFLNLISIIFLTSYSFAETEKNKELYNQIDKTYLNPKIKSDYILDSGDSIFIKFLYAEELSGIYSINSEGEVLLPKINYAFIRGLALNELKYLLEEKYRDILVNPELEIRLSKYKPVRVFIRGEVRSPGAYKLRYENNDKLIPQYLEKNDEASISIMNNYETKDLDNLKNNSSILDIKNFDNSAIKLSSALYKAGGLTSYSDISKIEIIRDVPLGNGSGKKKANIDLTNYIYNYDPNLDIRLFDGDIIFVPKLDKPNPNLVRSSVLTRVTPRFIEVDITGRIENPGVRKIPIEGTLSDVIDISGPIKPLSGKVIILRYQKDGSFTRKKINFFSKAKKGSSRNPYLKDDDIITVTDGFLGRSTKILKEITDPFIGIYTTKEVLEDLTE